MYKSVPSQNLSDISSILWFVRHSFTYIRSSGVANVDNWRGEYSYIVSCCMINFFWNRLFLSSVNMNIWIFALQLSTLNTQLVRRRKFRFLRQVWIRLYHNRFSRIRHCSTNILIIAFGHQEIIVSCINLVDKSIDDELKNLRPCNSNSFTIICFISIGIYGIVNILESWWTLRNKNELGLLDY